MSSRVFALGFWALGLWAADFVLADFLPAGFLSVTITRLSQAAPIPPLAFLGRKKRIACLGHSGGKDVLAADID
ncbi:MAG TPA: hypothetical protein VGQ61_04785, partial [Candidatus Angelobacter sp.]|nr:hypothetical protein [Candidatus Angelobacter sp.]